MATIIPYILLVIATLLCGCMGTIISINTVQISYDHPLHRIVGGMTGILMGGFFLWVFQ